MKKTLIKVATVFFTVIGLFTTIDKLLANNGEIDWGLNLLVATIFGIFTGIVESTNKH